MTTQNLDELLNQYIDNELVPKDRQRCEMLIDADPSLRQRVYDMEEASYQLLESFAKIQPSGGTQRHLEMVRNYRGN